MERKLSLPFKLIATVMIVFLLSPIVLLVPLSFSNDPYLVFPPNEWGFNGYINLIANMEMFNAFRISVVLGLVVTVLSLAVAIPASYVIVKSKSAFTEILYNLFTAPLLLPTIVLGLAMLMVFASQGLFGTFLGLTIAHLVVVTPVALRIIATAMQNVPVATEEAAASLGAPPVSVFMRITLPQIAPGISAAAALGFLTSFDEAVISLFITGPSITTLPVAMFHYLERRADPLVACVSVVLIILTCLVVALIARGRGLSRTFAN